ncbi:DUF92 domain-containing protein [Desertivirga arenae]|uniref:DUF92 domain-containing protein n=1 Tax=Desertivirga arenae TaxID=2810309 RepID=UPI001A97CD96|nr:DUF92 domain-containing protein [Pedobacter sp. SYSU D00823]
MSQYIVPLSTLILLMLLVYRAQKLTAAGTLAGGIVAIGVFSGAGYPGILMLGAFFLLATLATSWRKTSKEKLGLREANHGKRDVRQVLANGGIAALIGYCALFFPEWNGFIHAGIAGAFSSATADTLSSELGNVYGSRYFNVLTFKNDQRGLDGVISLEGTIAGLAGSILVASIFFYYSNNLPWSFTIIVAGLVGNLSDSVLGATWERKGILGNNAVNFINTLIGAAVAMILSNFF